jgi:hypothetical protein
MDNLEKDLNNDIINDENETTEEEKTEQPLEDNSNLEAKEENSNESKEPKDDSEIISIDDVIRNLSKKADEEETSESANEGDEESLDITVDNVDKIEVDDVMESEDEDRKKQEELAKQEEEDEDRYDPNALPTVLSRIEAGLIGTLRLKDNMNAPIFRKGDFIHFTQSNRIEKKDFILYVVKGEYFIRRVIRFDGLDIYVAGDSEKEYHIVHKEDIIAKAIGRQRRKKYLSLALNPKHKLYTFGKVNLAYFRLKNRVTSYDNDVSNQAFEAAMEQTQANVQLENVNKPEYDTTGIDLDSDLQSFLDPDELVRQLNEANRQQAQQAEPIEEIQYIEVDEEGNEIVHDENEEAVEEIVEEPQEEIVEEVQEQAEDDVNQEENASNQEENTEVLETKEENNTDAQNTENKPKPKVQVKKINLKK